MTGPLLRAARALAGMRAEQLAMESGLGLATIKRAEAAPGAPNLTPSNAARLIEVYALHGVHFVVDGALCGVLITRE